MMSQDAKNKIADKLQDAAEAIRNYNLEVRYKERIEPVEKTIQEHPIPAVLTGLGVGILIGALIYRQCHE